MATRPASVSLDATAIAGATQIVLQAIGPAPASSPMQPSQASDNAAM
jgi:hypothetical protein